MGRVESFAPHILVMGILSSNPAAEQAVRDDLEQQYGPVAHASEKISFTFTTYYNREMGEGIQRHFLVFRDTVDPEVLASVKEYTNELELRFCEGGCRRINIDPGLLSPKNLILATTKCREHRIPLMRGIYGEVTLIYMHGNYTPLPWTYADYRDESTRQFFTEIRNQMCKKH